MNMKLYKPIKHQLVDLTVILIAFLGLGNIILSLPFKYKILTHLGSEYSFFSPETVSLHKSMSTIIGFALIFISYRLYKRVKTAWIITLCLLPISVFLHIAKFSNYSKYITILEIVIIIILIITRNNFKRMASPITFKWGIILAFVSIWLVILNTALGLLLMKSHFQNISDFIDSIVNSFKLLYFMDVSYIEPKTRAAVVYGQSAIIINWASIILALFLVLKPTIYQPIISLLDREKVRGFLKLFGRNPISYVAIENDKKYFFGTTVEGVIAYTIAGGTAVCAGDPICDEEDMVMLLSEFITFCRQNDNDICFCQVTKEALRYFVDIGFGATKYGEEAMFELEIYDLAGGKGAKIRNAVNHANRLGIEVFEYKPFQKRNKLLEEQIEQVSKEWLGIKKSGELSFMLGSVSLDNPMDRRYFVANDHNNNVLGFVVFTPFLGGNGFLADVTRRRKDAPIGVMEKIIITAFNTMRDEGIKWGSLGLAPLYNVEDSENSRRIINSLLNYVYENMNHLYGFKTLCHYKKKYSPTLWEPRYLTCYPNVFSTKIAYSIIKSQNSNGIIDYLLSYIQNKFKKN